MQIWAHPTRTDAPIALVLHGTASAPDFIRRTFCTATHARGFSLATYALHGHGPHAEPPPYSFARHLADLHDIVTSLQPTVLGGLSLGAHLTATYTATSGAPCDLLLALPAWTGAPGPVAAANAVQAQNIRTNGVNGCLASLDDALRDGELHWVYDEMACTWPLHQHLAEIFEMTAAAPGPGVEQLALIRNAVGIASAIDDPLHPYETGEQWAELLPRARLRALTMAQFGADRGLVGELAWQALEAARAS